MGVVGIWLVLDVIGCWMSEGVGTTLQMLEGGGGTGEDGGSRESVS